MNQSTTIESLAAALAKTQAVALIAHKGEKNSHLNSNYANLEDVYKAVRKPMADNGLSFSQFPGEIRDTGGGKFVMCMENMLMHASGQYLSHKMEMAIPSEMKGLNLAQVFGLIQSYARRYGICAVLGVATSDDEDAQNAWRAKESEAVKEVGNETWQQLYDSGAWRERELVGDPDWRNIGQVATSELRAAIKLNIDNGGGNAALVAAQATMLLAAAKARGFTGVDDALAAAKWKGGALFDMTPEDMTLAYNTVITLPKKDAKPEGAE